MRLAKPSILFMSLICIDANLLSVHSFNLYFIRRKHMIIKQISVFVENKKGRLAAITDILAENDVDISALSLADTSDFGILRLIVDKPDVAQEALTKAGVTVKITDVIAVVMDDVPGGVAQALKVVSDNDISIEYMYACVGKTTGKALMVIRTEDTNRAEKILCENGFGKVNPAYIYRIGCCNLKQKGKLIRKHE